MTISEETRQKMEAVLKVVNETPYYRLLGMKFVRYGDGTSVLEMEFSKDLANIYGIAHGGAIASLADSACGIALSTKLPAGVHAVTSGLNVNYIAPFKHGEKLIAHGEVVNIGRTTALESARLTQDGKLIAVAQAVHFIKGSKK